jgi:hypothetical protein
MEDSMSCFQRDFPAALQQALQQAGALNQQARELNQQARLTHNPEAYGKAYEQSVHQAYKVAYTQVYQVAATEAYEFYYPQALQASEGDVERATAAATASATAAANTANLHAAAHVTALETLSKGGQILNPKNGSFYEFLRVIGFDVTNRDIMKCICRAKPDVARIDRETFQELWSSGLEELYTAMGGSITRSNRGKKLITDLNNHKHKHNKLARNNRTHRNKNKRKKNSKSKSHKPKPKSNPKSKPKPKSHKSKSGKSKRKNVTFKRRKRSNRH